MSTVLSQFEVPEPYLTFKQAARAMNVPYFKVQRAAQLGIVPVYRLLNSRPYVKRSDLERLMGESQTSMS